MDYELPNNHDKYKYLRVKGLDHRQRQGMGEGGEEGRKRGGRGEGGTGTGLWNMGNGYVTP